MQLIHAQSGSGGLEDETCAVGDTIEIGIVAFTFRPRLVVAQPAAARPGGQRGSQSGLERQAPAPFAPVKSDSLATAVAHRWVPGPWPVLPM